jgi:hypothetical protein
MSKLIFEHNRGVRAVIKVDPTKAGIVGTGPVERVFTYKSPLICRLEDALGISTIRPFPFGSNREKETFEEGFPRKLDVRFQKIDEAFRAVMAQGCAHERKVAICMLGHSVAIDSHCNTLTMTLANLHLNSLGERKQLKKHVERLSGLLHEFGVESARRICVSMGAVADRIIKPLFVLASAAIPISFAAVGTEGFSKPLDGVGKILLGAFALLIAHIDKTIVYGHRIRIRPLEQSRN